MPISTDLSIPPYDDDYSPSKDFYKILFQPGVSVQTRELNQLQTLFQTQLERFGDNIFATGTIVSGCNFLFLNPYPYIKIQDQSIYGEMVSPASFVGYKIMNETTGLSGIIIDYADGYEATAPDLKTLYIDYKNTGYNSNVSRFDNGDVLKIYNGTTQGIEKITVTNGGDSFANTDQVLAIPAIAITVNTGTFVVGDYITNSLGANLEITVVDTTTLANSNQIILKLKPRTVDLANSLASASSWTLSLNQDILELTTGGQATITRIIGSGMIGDVLTDPNGTIVNINVTNKGFGYDVLPFITMISYNNGGGIDTLDLTPQNYVTKVTLSSGSNSVGDGYAFGITEGVIYQKGYFLRVLPQTIVIDKYGTTPDNIAVGFHTVESIVTSNFDDSLNDPTAGKNRGAPGANRLKLVPRLMTAATEEMLANTTTLPLVEWNRGFPYLQRQETVYSKIGDKIAEGIKDQSGNFYIDPFLTTTQSSIANDTSASFDIVMDPGVAYIDGYRVETQKNFTLNYPVSFMSLQQNNYSLRMNYASYIPLNNLGGLFKFNTGDQVTLYNTAKNFISNSTLIHSQNTATVGTVLGTARMRGLELDSENAGNPIYRLYVFDVQMANGKNFADTRSVHYAGTSNGVADVVTSLNTTTGQYQATIVGPSQSSLVFPISSTVIKNIANTTYPFRTMDTSLTVNTAGFVTKSIAANSTWFYPYTATLSSDQRSEIYLTPTSVDLVYSTNTTGTVYANSTSNSLIGTTTNFLSEYNSGDWIFIHGASSDYDIKQVRSVTNNTFLTLDSSPAWSNATSHITRCFPRDVPIPLWQDGFSANVDVNQNILTINLGGALTAVTPSPVALGVNINQVNITEGTKTPVRKVFVKLRLSDNADGTTGPWCLGVPDVFRLRGVYVGGATVASTMTNNYQNFYIDNNQNVDYYGLSWLYLRPSSSLKLTSANYLLVEFDYFTAGGIRYFTPVSYLSANTNQVISLDSLALNQLDVTSGAVNTWEVPEFFTNGGVEVDLLQCLDFRIAAQATATPNATEASAPINPSSVETFDSEEKYFPVPEATHTCNIESWLGNFVSLFIDKTGKISTSNSTITTTKISSAPTPPGAMKITDLIIPAYPAIPINRSVRLTEIMNTGLANMKFASRRAISHLIVASTSFSQNQPRVYTQSDLGSIDRRLRNVEYYVSLNQSESALNTLVIPSSNDPALARYKFGFFSVNFDTPVLMDINNPQYAASNKNGFMWPSRLDWEIQFGDDYNGALPYVQEAIITQTNATIGTVTDPEVQPNCAITIANTTATQLLFRNVGDAAGRFAPTKGQVDVVNITLADLTHMSNNVSAPGAQALSDFWAAEAANTVTLYFYNYDSSVKMEIYQGANLVVDSSPENVKLLTAAEMSNLTGEGTNFWFNDQTSQYMKPAQDRGNKHVAYAGKLVWNYDGHGGQNVTIKITHGDYVKFWRYVAAYPINGDTAGCLPPATNIDVVACGNMFYTDLTQALMQAITKNGGTTVGINGTIEYGIDLDLDHSYVDATGTVDLAEYLADPTSSKLTLDAINLYVAGVGPALAGSQGTPTDSAGRVLVGGNWHQTTTWDAGSADYNFQDIINNQIVDVYYWLDPHTGALIETTSATSSQTGIVRVNPDWAQTVANGTLVDELFYTGEGSGGNVRTH